MVQKCHVIKISSGVRLRAGRQLRQLRLGPGRGTDRRVQGQLREVAVQGSLQHGDQVGPSSRLRRRKLHLKNYLFDKRVLALSNPNRSF